MPGDFFRVLGARRLFRMCRIKSRPYSLSPPCGTNFELLVYMPRKPIELSDTYPVHICARCNNKDWFSLPLPMVMDIYIDVLERTINSYNFKVHAFVLMSNHYHALISTPDANLSAAMRYFMTESSHSIARTSGRINRVYGARYSGTLIKESEHYAHTLKYIYNNPVKANITDRAEKYRWSSLNGDIKKLEKLLVPASSRFNEFVPHEKQTLIEWLGRLEDFEYIEAIRKALRKRVFKFGQNKKTGKKPCYIDRLHPKRSPGT